MLFKRRMITQSDAVPGLAVLAPLRGTFTSFVCLTDRRGMAHRVPPRLSPASMRPLLADSLRSALRIASPGTAPACSSASVRVVKKGTIVEARAPLLLQGLSAALRLLRWARSQAQGCDWQFGLAWMALPERSVGTTWKPKSPR